MQLIYKPYEDDEEEDEAEPEPYELLVEEQNITDIKSAAGPRPDSALLRGGPLLMAHKSRSLRCKAVPVYPRVLAFVLDAMCEDRCILYNIRVSPAT